MSLASIARLGFDIRDVKMLLNSHAHFDHAGGLAALQFGRWRKQQARDTARNPVDPVIDRAGYLDFIDQGEADFRKALAKQTGS